jgi:EAL domain-containing protein (putative c-di-GMP-specific phosphodiesterase class I)/GGDEF domain-containing protein
LTFAIIAFPDRRRRPLVRLLQPRHGEDYHALFLAIILVALAAWSASCGWPWAWMSLVAGGALALILKRAMLDHSRLRRLIIRLSGGETRSLQEALILIATRLKAYELRLQATHPVSGLPTREQLFDAIARDIEPEGGSSCLGVLRFANYDRIADLDQARADEMMKGLAERLSRASHRDHMLCQIERNCVAIWLSGRSGSGDLVAEFQALIFVVDQEIEAEGVSLNPQLEAGHACFPDDGETPARLLARAIACISQRGRQVAPSCTAPATGTSLEELALERDLSRAIDMGQLSMVYQPVVDLAAGRLVGAEALLRWNHPERGQISPSRFIPIVEAMGLSEAYGLWVLNAAARQARVWQAEGLEHLTMAVNLSAHQLLDDGLGPKILRTIERHRLDAGMIELELTESAAMADVRHTELVFARLRERGVKLAIDDFGTGYSSLIYLKQLSFDKLKIDRSFVTDIQHRRDSRAICRALVELAAGLDITILAEGVECEEEVSALLDLGCRLFQGYYFARPMPGDAFLVLARDADWLGRLASHRKAAQSADPLEHYACR